MKVWASTAFSSANIISVDRSSPNLLLAAMAARTKTMRLGVMGVVVPHYPASRVIEEIGLLDQLSGGRLEIGTAVGVPQELSRAGLGMDEARAIYNESVEILDATLENRNSEPCWQVFQLRKPAPSAAAGAKAVAAEMVDGRQHGYSATRDATNQQDLRRLCDQGASAGNLRRLSC
jgi:alkanesulfonate monooxygenase SsuD/methylene tetrahydromethanopterin reductase-like flavin-dependent oxidoreductase (luciferase family)